MVSTGSSNCGLINRDDGSIGVGDQVGVQVEGASVAVARSVGTSVANSGNGSGSNDRGGSNNGSSSGKSSSLGGKVISTGSGNGGLINRDDSSVGVGDQVGVQVEGSTIAVGNWGSMGVDSTDSNGSGNNGSSSSVGSSLGGEVVGTGSSNGGLINRDNGSVGVGDQVGVQVEGASVAVARSVGTSVANSGNGSSSNKRGGSNDGSSSNESSSLGGEVISTGSGNCGLVNRDNGTVGVGDKVGVQVKGAGVAVSRSVGRGGSVANSGNGGSSVANGTSSNNGTSSELGGKVVGLQGSHTGLVNGGDGSVGVTLQAKETLGGREGETRGENLEENFNSLFTPLFT